ncbi:MAG: hypothetical protein GXP45_07840 [bacterium]|nr:hypothetical protein [bacterium]
MVTVFSFYRKNKRFVYIGIVFLFFCIYMPVREAFEANSFYYIMNHSGSHRILWRNSVDFEKFMQSMLEYLVEYPDIALLAYAVLPDHYQLLLKNGCNGYAISQFLKKLQISYAMYYKKKYASSFLP